MGAIGRRQRSALLALEVIVQDQFVVVFGKDQVKAGSLEISVEKQLRVRNDNGIRRSVRGARRNRLDMDVRIGMRPRPSAGKSGVEFANEIQRATAKS